MQLRYIKLLTIYSCGSLLLWRFTLVAVYSCGGLLLWRFALVAVYSCGGLLLWQLVVLLISLAVSFYSRAYYECYAQRNTDI